MAKKHGAESLLDKVLNSIEKQKELTEAVDPGIQLTANQMGSAYGENLGPDKLPESGKNNPTEESNVNYDMYISIAKILRTAKTLDDAKSKLIELFTDARLPGFGLEAFEKALGIE